MAKTDNLRFIANDLEVLLPMADRLARWIDDLPLLSIICKTCFDHVLGYVALCRGQEVY